MSDAPSSVPRIPFPWAVGLTVIVGLIPGTFLGDWNFTLWAVFIVWAEYFALGAVVTNWKLIFPSIPLGALSAAGWIATYTALNNWHSGGTFFTFLWLSLANLVWVVGLVWIMGKWKVWNTAALACFNGLTLFLALYFTSSAPKMASITNVYAGIAWTFVWVLAMAYFGWFLGWLNVVLTFPRTVSAPVDANKAEVS